MSSFARDETVLSRDISVTSWVHARYLGPEDRMSTPIPCRLSSHFLCYSYPHLSTTRNIPCITKRICQVSSRQPAALTDYRCNTSNTWKDLEHQGATLVCTHGTDRLQYIIPLALSEVTHSYSSSLFIRGLSYADRRLSESDRADGNAGNSSEIKLGTSHTRTSKVFSNTADIIIRRSAVGQ